MSDIEAIQFFNTEARVARILEFVDALDHEVTTNDSRMFGTRAYLGISSIPWTGSIGEGDWLVKRNGKVADLTSKQYEILFGKGE